MKIKMGAKSNGYMCEIFYTGFSRALKEEDKSHANIWGKVLRSGNSKCKDLEAGAYFETFNFNVNQFDTLIGLKT